MKSSYTKKSKGKKIKKYYATQFSLTQVFKLASFDGSRIKYARKGSAVKKVIYIFVAVCFFSSYTQPEIEKSGPSVKLASALRKAKKELSKLFLTEDDRAHLAEYFEFYASWYAPVTPASKELYDSLSRQALDFVEKIKRIAKPLEKKQDRRLLGASRLSG